MLFIGRERTQWPPDGQISEGLSHCTRVCVVLRKSGRVNHSCSLTQIKVRIWRWPLVRYSRVAAERDLSLVQLSLLFSNQLYATRMGYCEPKNSLHFVSVQEMKEVYYLKEVWQENVCIFPVYSRHPIIQAVMASTYL